MWLGLRYLHKQKFSGALKQNFKEIEVLCTIRHTFLHHLAMFQLATALVAWDMKWSFHGCRSTVNSVNGDGQITSLCCCCSKSSLDFSGKEINNGYLWPCSCHIDFPYWWGSRLLSQLLLFILETEMKVKEAMMMEVQMKATTRMKVEIH